MSWQRRRVLRCAASGLAAGLSATPVVPRRRAAAIRCVVTLPAGASTPIALWLPIPRSDAHQRVTRLTFTGVDQHQIHTGSNGNRYLFTTARAGQTVRLEFQVERTERRGMPSASRSGPAAQNCCLGSDRLVPVDGQIRAWAEDVVRQAGAKSDEEKARAIYEHVIATVKYDKSGHGWGRGDIYYACDQRRGNCSDFHAIFIGYARALGIPAKFAIGLPLPRERGAGAIAGYHCWAEFFTARTGWVPIDASEAAKDPPRRQYFFGALDENRVEFTQGRDLILSPRQAGAPLNFFVHPYAEAGGQPVAELPFQLTYRDI